MERTMTALRLILPPDCAEEALHIVPCPPALPTPPSKLVLPNHDEMTVLGWQTREPFTVDLEKLPAPRLLASFIEVDGELLVGFYCYCRVGDSFALAPTWGMGLRPVVRIDPDLCAEDEDVEQAQAYNAMYLTFLHQSRKTSPSSQENDQLWLFPLESPTQKPENPVKGE